MSHRKIEVESEQRLQPGPNAVITVAPTDMRLQQRALDAPGGFLWWYLDVVDDRGNGAVVIWSYGLPFLPGYAAAARHGDAETARERPSLNVSVYRDWELECYLLREFDPEQVDGDGTGTNWSFGGSEMRIAETSTGRRVDAEIDCGLPGTEERLTGIVTVDGTVPRCEANGGVESEASHSWTPLAVPASGRVDLAVGDTADYQFEGRAYHDSNAGTEPLHELGIERWIWGRAPVGDREIVYYGLWDDDGSDRPARSFAIVLGSDGAVDRFDSIELELRDGTWNLGGMRWWREIGVSSSRAEFPALEVRHRSAVDSGPFYMRYLTEVRAAGERSTGVGELIRPDRVDLDRHRPLVRMRVDRGDRANSMWLPLFTGPRRGRVRRLLRYNLGGGAS